MAGVERAERAGRRRRSLGSEAGPNMPAGGRRVAIPPTTPLKRGVAAPELADCSLVAGHPSAMLAEADQPRTKPRLIAASSRSRLSLPTHEPATPSPTGAPALRSSVEEQAELSPSAASSAAMSSCSSEAASARMHASGKAGAALSLMARAAACCTPPPPSALVPLQPRGSLRSSRRQPWAPTCSLAGIHVSVFWQDDRTFYKGVVTATNEQRQHHVRYEDDQEEWLALADERFTWLGPRGKSAGCTPAIRDYLAALGCEGLVHNGVMPSPGLPQALGPAACGWHIAIFFLGTASSIGAQVIAFNPHSRRHHIVYADGFDEWLLLAEEAVQWLHCAHSSCLCLPPGRQEPQGAAAVGWQVAVYDAEDQIFFGGCLAAFEAEAGVHQLRAPSGEECWVQLAACRVKWLAAPASHAHALQAPEPPRACVLRAEDAVMASPRGSSASCSMPSPQPALHWALLGAAATQPPAEDLLMLPPGPGLLSLNELLPHTLSQPASPAPPRAAHLAGLVLPDQAEDLPEQDLLDAALGLHVATSTRDPWTSSIAPIYGDAFPSLLPAYCQGGSSSHESCSSLAPSTHNWAVSGHPPALAETCPELAFLDLA